ncbi:methane/phenol/toluene hydroxylase [Sulfobacillus acidophilus TPY]|uniref:propane 2-monooxygenase n=1 Tax=Sulfobacillus acidophilus (strain ATCC 700253 / DSM 10332 / NAL) TaxID=679936 RepID=G8U0C7_SULAD|nr:methane/phenol/toluene hydroxylase [Sulfobacillus acidophilus TPY]AEW06469.1 phenol 2-monooxygenase P3 subunit [Sulfobacillus acidophilus DSM 10332]
MASKKLSMKETYRNMVRGLDWEPTYQPADKIFPYHRFEGIKIHDWDQWEDPFRMTVETYWKYQAEKDRRFYAILDGFIQSQGHLNLSDARYLSALKLFLQGVTPLEYMAHRSFSFLARYLPGSAPRFAALAQSMDELRHAQTEIHAISPYNRYYSGLHSMRRWHDRAWYLSVPKSFFDDAVTSGPFEFLTAISFGFEYLITNLLFVPFMSGASFNGDLTTMTFGFSAQSDESRHMTLGLESVKFMLEQDEDNVPIVQAWIDKWFWRSYRVAALVAAMMDYMLPRRFMSWKEAFELYFEEQMMEGLFPDLKYYGINPPRHVQQAIKEKEYLSHQVYWVLYSFTYAAMFHTWVPEPDELDWLSGKYPGTFDEHFRPLFERARAMQKQGQRFYFPGLPQLCQVCQIPMAFTEPGHPTKHAQFRSVYQGETYWTCSEGCHWIFEREPEKYVQAWLPVHEIFKGNCGGPTVPDVLAWYGDQGDSGDYQDSQDHRHWVEWHNKVSELV